jgi:hypothetical protein
MSSLRLPGDGCLNKAAFGDVDDFGDFGDFVGVFCAFVGVLADFGVVGIAGFVVLCGVKGAFCFVVVSFVEEFFVGVPFVGATLAE